MSSARDPFLDLSLRGVQLIEASAGTGKTYTLATLVTRLVVERGLRVGQILAVTFTEAATQELRKRIRERLELALQLLDAPSADAENAESMLTREVLATHLSRSGESRDALRLRLRQATLDTDLAAIFTIHGFCLRVLREHALESGHGFDAPELLANDDDLRELLGADLWRQRVQDADGADDLAALWPGGYEALAQDLQTLLREPVLLPSAVSLPPDPRQTLLEAGAALAEGFRVHGDAFLADLLDAIERKVLNGQSYRAEWIEPLWRELARWCEAGDFAASTDERIARLTDAALQAKTNKAHVGRTPNSPLCALIQTYLVAVQAQEGYLAARRARLLHRVRDDARAGMALLKRQRRVQTYDDLIGGVADALRGAHGDALVRGLRAQYAFALVDEFQDTDARQWAIFERVFGDDNGVAEPALFLIGDPKQAIYGFRGGDVHTYLAAAGVATRAPALSHNFRSRPALLSAVATLYRNAQAAFEAKHIATPPFVDARIAFHAVEAGNKDADGDCLSGVQPAPALTLWQAPSPPLDAKGKRRRWSASASRELATRACVAAIHRVLADACDGKATLRDKRTKAMRAIAPGDVAVLVRSHREATLVQQALATAGIPAVAAGRQSLFATAEARELHTLLLALLHGGDDGRLRTALATVLIGVEASAIAALDADAAAHREWHQRAQDWEERLLRGGPLALVSDLCALHAPRLLGLVDGERRVGNYLQLAEQLQEAQRSALGLHGLVDWLGQRIATADPGDDTQLLRLESDANRVQIVTLHQSKGLEYPLVFLPFAAIGRKDDVPGRRCIAHDPTHGRRLHWKLDLPDAEWDKATSAWKREQRAEEARLLYVGLTRAEHALWLATGEFFIGAGSPLAAMLGDEVALREAGVVFDAAEPLATLPRLRLDADAAVPPARAATRRLSRDWWVYSFSQLAKADAGDVTAASTVPASGGNDEREAGGDGIVHAAPDSRFAGNRYGVALHAALEHADFAAWRGWRKGEAAPPGQDLVIADALRGEGYGADVLDDGVALTTHLIGQTLNAALPEGVRLCDVPADARRAEIEFQFALQPTRVDALLRLLHAHGIVRERHGFGLRQRLEGLMTGMIDLTYRHDGRWYVVDYKSNRLPGYDDGTLRRAMADSEYDLQALIYTFALHRWLRFRLGGDYDYARDFGGVRYLFCRGLDVAAGDGAGIHAQRFAPQLVHALDALFGGTRGDVGDDAGRGASMQAAGAEA